MNTSQILNADHHHWIAAFLQYQLTQLDRAKAIRSAGRFTENIIEDVAEDVAVHEPGMRPLEVISLSEVEPNFYLGAKQSEPLVIKDLQTHGPCQGYAC